MVKGIISNILKDIVLILRKENDFFDLSEKDRKSVLSNFNRNYPDSLNKYLSGADGESFMQDMRRLLFYVSDGKITEKSELLNAVADYFVTDIAQIIDSYSEKKYVGDVYLSEELSRYLENFSEQEISREVFSFLKEFNEVPLIIVQSPEYFKNRSEIRGHFLKEYPNSFVEFQKKDELLGGIKVFINGVISDHSWLAKVARVESLAAFAS